MNFISIFRNHYEKIILVGLLIIFAGLLYWQLSIIQEAQNKRVDQIVGQRDPDPDYILAGYLENPRYGKDVVFHSALVWEDWKKDDPQSKVDIMTSAPLSVCPHCKRFIPMSCFPKMGSKDVGKCPLSGCGKALKARKSNEDVADVKVPVADDADGNGLPDKWEQEYKIAGSKDTDPDKDGFSNLEEFRAKTSPVDPKSHPLYVTKLQLATAPKKERLEALLADDIKKKFHGTIQLKEVSTSDKDKNKWEAVFAISNRGKKKTPPYLDFRKVGEEIAYRKKQSLDKKVPTIGFKVVEIIRPEGKGQEGKAIIERNGLRLECLPGKIIWTPYDVIEFVNETDNSKIQTRTGAEIQLGTEATGIEKYTVTGVNGSGEQSEVILSGAKDTKYTIKKSSPEAAAPSEKEAAEK